MLTEKVNYTQNSHNDTCNVQLGNSQNGCFTISEALYVILDEGEIIGFRMPTGDVQLFTDHQAQQYTHAHVGDETVWFDETRTIHRTNGPALVNPNKYMEWWRKGVRHRDGGPAVVHFQRVRQWWVNGQLHRLNKPAVEGVNGDVSWWVNGVDTLNPDLCWEASRADLTDEQFYQLCTHEDYVVQQIAAANPHCPQEWKVLVALKMNTNTTPHPP